MKYQKFSQIVIDNVLMMGCVILGPYLYSFLQGVVVDEALTFGAFVYSLILLFLFCYLNYKALGYLFDGVSVFQLRSNNPVIDRAYEYSWNPIDPINDKVNVQFESEVDALQGTPRDVILGRDELENGVWKRALDLSMKKVKPNLSNLKRNAYMTFKSTRYSSPIAGYFSALVSGLFSARASRFRRFLGRVPLLKRLFRHQYRFTKSNYTVASGPSGPEQVEVHLPTVGVAYMAMFSYMESMFKCLSIKSTRRLTPAERSFWVGQHCLEKLVIHLNSKNEYQVNSGNAVMTAQVIFYQFLLTTGKCLPLIDICNTIDQSSMDEFYELMDNDTTDMDGNVDPAFQFLHFPYPFAGSVAIDNTSMV